MPVPYEALIPLGIISGCFGVTGVLLRMLKESSNDGKPIRTQPDPWTHRMMERDFRLTGSYRGQTHEPIAPKEFATNSVWRLEPLGLRK
ncbi:hypothetical protein K493DRAFT_232171 [Basidiobolus meristosporus CBS 931.73]|uniref:NADH dehydrogenase [ubiquinone] 1 alpha subcomplex subunit 1 n=1 Tax=Basidiobolus meristosporus CBS 931.73 TaxID=1314790 RepID=A0A1Y1XVS3_9FUNG|nr:hypothetical protein K493DRAFT_364510 [Basidiobolus meristosporus CBS 931.73]ORX89861.1 hypothetical protein K493DRAFT_232171 [Basidiobolus meristosporus CBS 931.73]|eukprot:ORX68061.1 hypothetical protein K493DRAFT_364510 [Basidiobolus meristosporus CBS 931.73]